MDEKLDLGLDFGKIQNHADYHAVWNRISRVEIKMVEQHEKCKHCVGDTFYYETPYDKPKDVCTALLHVIDLYTWRVSLGFPSWISQDPSIHRLHCPDPKGTVWEVRRAPED